VEGSISEIQTCFCRSTRD